MNSLAFSFSSRASAICALLMTLCLGNLPTLRAKTQTSAQSAAPTSPPASSQAVPPAPAAPDPVKEKALAEIDEGPAKFQERITNESSEVTQAAMKTRLTVLNQRRADLAKDFTQARFESLKEDLRKEVKVKDKMTPAVDPPQKPET